MFKRKELTDIYLAYVKKHGNLFEQQDMLETLWTSNKKYKGEILYFLETAVAENNIQKLQFCIAVAFTDGVDNDYSDIFYQIILDTWHEEHEDIVDMVFEFKEERFCEALLRIALEGKTYRKFDDENESTLRKCIYALVAIDTDKSNEILEKLKHTKNPNVQIALDMNK